MACPAGRVKTRFQPLTAVLPVLVIVMLLVRPVFHALTAFTTRQVPVPPGLLFEGEGDGEPGVLDDDGETGGVLGDPPPTAVMMALMMPCWVTVLELRLNRPSPYWPL